MEKVVIMIIESATNVFWVTSTCRNSEHFEKLDYNSRVCAQCLGVFDKNKKNFGDMITPYIYSKITGKNPIRTMDRNSTEPVCFGSGSIMNLCKQWKNVIIWGTGIVHSKDEFDRPQKVFSVRGPLTRKRFLELGYDCPKIYGDPGLLLPKFYNKTKEKKYKIGIIPHYVDYEFCKKLFLNISDISVIDVCNDVENVIDEITMCERTISSSLHGIIVSHAYGIKSCWVEISNFVYGDNTKFLDYYYSQDLIDVNKPISIKEFQSLSKNIVNLIDTIENFPNPDFPLDTTELMNTCPF